MRTPTAFVLFSALAASLLGSSLQSTSAQKRTIEDDVFRQLEETLPTPNDQRAASGAPGHRYWQQKADYNIAVELDDENQRLMGSETITYQNNSPDSLSYLWVQLDQNRFTPGSDDHMSGSAPNFDRVPYRSLRTWLAKETFQGGFNIHSVKTHDGQPLPHTVVKTMMRIDLPEPLASQASTTFSITWDNNIVPARTIRARGGYEHFEDDDNYLYEIAQWFPRMAVYDDVNGWQNKQFLGNGEFALTFGNYYVSITAPNDHIVASTGVLQNPGDVLTQEQMDRLEESKSADRPMFIVTPEEAEANESSEPTGKKTWTFYGENVRDFAWASSRKFIWDAVGHDVMGNQVMAMSYYPKEGEPLWSKYSTHSIVHTLDVYSKFTFAYPYPVAISVNGPIGGMEYPMICFNGPRPEKDGTYSKRTKYGLIGVIIHEVGHNYFPMIVNSDERQWTWMDEGLNTFVQYLAEQEWEDEYPSRRGEPKNITGYMASTNQVPIMTNSESLLQFGNNAYAKPATALNILRETILGRELFDFAFKTYSQRWMFKHPQPADLFRTMEDASAVDLDWFFRGWFYTTDHVDLGITDVRHYQIDTRNPDIEKPLAEAERDAEPTTLGEERNEDLTKRANLFEELKDFYNEFDTLDVTGADRRDFEKLMKDMEEKDATLLGVERNFYVVDFENLGGLVMPIILNVEYVGGESEEVRIPVEIWRKNPKTTSKLLMTTQEIERITLDPRLETADTDLSNNHYPPKLVKSRFKLFKDKKSKNPMQKARAEEERANGETVEEEAEAGAEG